MFTYQPPTIQPHYVQCASPAGPHRMAYYAWGCADNPKVLVCAHGLTRSGLDFETLAHSLSQDFYVISMDVVGRGASDWLLDPLHYAIPQYAADASVLLLQLRQLGAQHISWLGTSMGGLMGIALAAQSSMLPAPLIDRLVVNDVGPTLDATAVNRIGDYLGLEHRFADFEQAVAYIQNISKTFGPHSPEQWAHLTRNVIKPVQQGGFTLHYDLRIADSFHRVTPQTAAAGQMLMWQCWDAIVCPTLLIRGQLSDLLSVQTAHEMTQRGPRAKLVELPNVGHASMFQPPEHIRVVQEFLLAT